jgi:hypothetical protein
LALSDSDHLEALKTAGRLTVDYMIRGRRHTVEASTEALLRIEESIEIYERKAARGTRRTFRLASLQRARGRDG